MNTWPQFLTTISIRIALFACVLIAPSVCSAQVTNFAADTVFNLTDTKQATILITANWYTDVKAQISYLGAKPGQPPFPEVLIGAPLDIPPGQTQIFNINLNHPAFAGGYGAVRVRSVDVSGAPSTVPFIAYLRESDGETLSPVSGNHMVGSYFYIPTINGRAQRLRIVMTLLGSAGSAEIRIRSTNGYDESFILPVGTTFRFSSDEVTNFGGLSSGSILISTPSILIVSIYYEQQGPLGTRRKYHVHLPATAPF